MTKLDEALPFDPERWLALQAEGWRIRLGFGADLEVIACSNGLVVTKDEFGNLHLNIASFFDMLPPIPPPVVIEFKVGLFKWASNTDYVVRVIDPDFSEDSINFIRLLTPDERAKGEVRVDG